MKSLVSLFRPHYTSIKEIAKSTGYAEQTLYALHLNQQAIPYVVRVHLRRVIRTLIRDLEIVYKDLERDVK